MDGPLLRRIDGSHVIHWLPDHVHHASQRLITHRHFNGMPQAHGLHSAHHAVGGLQRDGAHPAFADVLRNFGHHVDGYWGGEAFAGDMHRRVNHWDLVFRELNVDGRSSHLDYFAFY